MSEAPPVTDASAAATTTMLRVEQAHVRHRVHTERPPTLRERVTGARRVRARSWPVLLGVGAALEPQMSGRHTIGLGLLALGMNRAETERLASEVRALRRTRPPRPATACTG